MQRRYDVGLEEGCQCIDANSACLLALTDLLCMECCMPCKSTSHLTSLLAQRVPARAPGSARAVNRSYIALFVPRAERTSASALFVSLSAIGMALGPLLALPLSRFPELSAFGLTFNKVRPLPHGSPQGGQRSVADLPLDMRVTALCWSASRRGLVCPSRG